MRKCNYACKLFIFIPIICCIAFLINCSCRQSLINLPICCLLSIFDQDLLSSSCRMVNLDLHTMIRMELSNEMTWKSGRNDVFMPMWIRQRNLPLFSSKSLSFSSSKWWYSQDCAGRNALVDTMAAAGDLLNNPPLKFPLFFKRFFLEQLNMRSRKNTVNQNLRQIFLKFLNIFRE